MLKKATKQSITYFPFTKFNDSSHKGIELFSNPINEEQNVTRKPINHSWPVTECKGPVF